MIKMGIAAINPWTMAALGAATGAAMNRDNPIQGALMGGVAGYGGANLLGGTGLLGQKAAAKAYAALPGMNPSAIGPTSQAFQLAEQTADPLMGFGLSDYMKTGEALRSVVPNAGLFGSFGKDQLQGMQMANSLMGQQEQQQPMMQPQPLQQMPTQQYADIAQQRMMPSGALRTSSYF